VTHLLHPAIDDPNTGLRLWESGAILHYLISQYDTAHHLSYPTPIESHLCNQWLAFQISGQGPYFGQAAHFNVLHPTRIPSVMARYNAEMRRILGVLDGALEAREWLVGDKCTYADLSFALWNERIDALWECGKEERFVGFANVEEWHARMTGRAAWKRVMAERERLMEVQGLGENGMPVEVENFQEYEELIRVKNEGRKE
jgi:glutathione S-transferase